jgi:hypothetical protein
VAGDKTQPDDDAKKYSQLVAKAWSDPSFKREFKSDPVNVMTRHGLQAPSQAKVTVVEDTANTVHFILPAKPTEQLTDDQLDQVAGGSTLGSAGSIATMGSICGCASTAGTVGCAGSAGV